MLLSVRVAEVWLGLKERAVSENPGASFSEWMVSHFVPWDESHCLCKECLCEDCKQVIKKGDPIFDIPGPISCLECGARTLVSGSITCSPVLFRMKAEQRRLSPIGSLTIGLLACWERDPKHPLHGVFQTALAQVLDFLNQRRTTMR